MVIIQGGDYELSLTCTTCVVPIYSKKILKPAPSFPSPEPPALWNVTTIVTKLGEICRKTLAPLRFLRTTPGRSLRRSWSRQAEGIPLTFGCSQRPHGHCSAVMQKAFIAEDLKQCVIATRTAHRGMPSKARRISYWREPIRGLCKDFTGKCGVLL